MRNGYFTSYILLFILVFLPSAFRVESEEANLLKNGDFEDSMLAGWEIEYWNKGGNAESSTRKVYNGQYVLLLYSGNMENDVRVAQEVSVEPDTYYRLSGWIATENVQSGKVGANICIITGFDYAGNVAGTTDWQFYELKFKTSKKHRVIKVGARLGMYYNTVQGTAFFDDLRLEKLDYTPKYAVILDEPGSTDSRNTDRNTDITTDRTRDDQTQKVIEKDPVFADINLPLIMVLILIGLGPLFLNAFFTIRREKKNGHTQ